MGSFYYKLSHLELLAPVVAGGRCRNVAVVEGSKALCEWRVAPVTVAADLGTRHHDLDSAL
jgi:hypothetical protein